MGDFADERQPFPNSSMSFKSKLTEEINKTRNNFVEMSGEATLRIEKNQTVDFSVSASNMNSSLLSQAIDDLASNIVKGS